MMRFVKEEEGAQNNPTPLRTFDVILLRDNRETKAGQSLRWSAFKGDHCLYSETEVDPLEDRPSDLPHHQEALEELLQRVAKLEQRVQTIEENRESSANSAPSGRKRRRRFEEMQRDIEVQLW
jgi:hypothetical protein